MKKSILLLLTIIYIFSGCATWKGIKKDSNDAWNATKGAIHEATE
ncbi:entericidin EcnAB [Malaciobacter molluscorum LMG 25693]|uniref:Entericidin EcnAB n=1 Tax=Malaciobacter molluscorum LMG 25693 TaxID=870501 RepID=A0A2G1DI26_9BACT|nr:entericidin EcnAB [Malaciobacter molluscorum]PHO18159.1 entericidin EcnAB [Malaciobacter molluscorum LMG 25693]RXJ93948.1 entericidin EcnAB [Malaciobacter molluscorum]